MTPRRSTFSLMIAAGLALAVIGCGSKEAYKLEPTGVDYEALERASSAEEDVSSVDVRALEQ